MKKFTKIFIIWALMLPAMAWAHDPDQISYHFAKADKTGSLTVHFTPKSALDLLLSRHAEFNENEAIRLSDYAQDFTQYFNETIVLKIGSKRIGFKFNKADFGGHDATIRFDLIGFEGTYEDLDINVSSFTEIYRRTGNHLFFPDQEEIVLNLANQRYSALSTRTTKAGTFTSPVSIMLFVVVMALIVGLGSRLSKKKMPR